MPIDELLGAELGGDAMEVDLHGSTKREAVETLEAAVQKAFMSGDRVIRVVHGRGDGILRSAALETAERHPLVVEIRASSVEREIGAVTYLLIAEREHYGR